MGPAYTKLKQRLVRGFKRYYVLRQLRGETSKRKQWAVAWLHSLQLLTLLLPLYAEKGDPWAHWILWPCWYVFNAVGRQDRLLQAFLGDMRVMEFIFGVLTVWRLATLVASLLYYGWKAKADYWRIVCGERESVWARLLQRADQVGCFLALFAVPAANLLTEVALCGTECGLLGFIGALALPAALAVPLLESFFSVDLSWRPNNDGPITPRFSLLSTISNMSLAVLAPFSSRYDHEFLLQGWVLIVGLAKTSSVYLHLPYHSVFGNVVESSQGLGLVWQAALLTLSRNVPQASLAPGLLLLLGIPLLVLINFHLISYRYHSFLLSNVRSKSQFAKFAQFAAFQPSNSSSSEEDPQNETCLAPFTNKNRKLYPLLWAAYYFLHTKNYYFSKVAVGLISEMSTSWVNSVQIETCRARLLLALQSDAEEKALQTFLTFNSLLTKVHKHDQATACILRDLNEGLDLKNVPFLLLLKLSKMLSLEASKAVSAYEEVIETFPKRYTLQQSYSGFLQMIGKTQKAEKYRSQAMKQTDRRRKRVVSGIDRLVYDDPHVILIVVPVTGPQKGRIAWGLNTKLLDYTEEDLKGQDCSILLPKALQAQHAEMLSRVPTMRSVPQITLSHSDLHICIRTQQKLLLNGAWRAFVANDQTTGELTIVVSIRLEPTEKEFAILSSSGELEERTPGFAAFVRETNFLRECNLQSQDVVWKGQWGGGLVLVSRDVWQISDQFKLTCVSLFKLRSRRGVSLKKGQLMMNAAKNLLETNTFFHSRISALPTSAISLVKTRQSRSKGNTVGIHRVKSQVKLLFRVLFLTFILIFLSGSAVTLVVEQSFAESVLEVSQSIAYITSIGMRTLSIRAALRSKELYLLNSGFQLYGNETAAKLDLDSISTSFRSMRTYLYGNSSSASGRYKEMLLEPQIPLWRYEGDQFNLYQVSILDLMDEVVRRTRNLANCPLVNITRSNGDFMTLYRNGVAESLYAFNTSLEYYGESKNEQQEQVLAVVELVATLGPLICGGVFLPLLAGLLMLLNSTRRKVWTALLAVPKSVSGNVRELVKSRIDDGPLEEATSSMTFSHSCRYESSPVMKVFVCSALLYCCVLSLSGLGFYLYGYNTMNEVLEYKAAYIDLQGQRRAAVAKIWFHMREAWLPLNLSDSAVYADRQPFYSSLQQWELATGLLLMLHRCLTLGCTMHNLHHLFPSDAHKDLLFGSLGTSPAVLTAGLTPFLNELAQLSSATEADLKANPLADYSQASKLEKYISLAYAAISQANQQFDADTAAQMQTSSDTLMQLSFVFICLAFLALVLLELPLSYMVSAMQVIRRVTREAEVLAYFPDVVQTETMVII